MIFDKIAKLLLVGFQFSLIVANPCFSLKADRYLERKFDQAEDILKRQQQRGKKWYSNFIGDAQGPKLNEFHIFTISFVAGLAIGMGVA